MSDTSGTQASAPEEHSGPKELREYADRIKSENDALKDQLTQLTDAARAQSFTLAGIPDEGVGKLLRKTYEGPVDVAEMQKFAAEYGFEPNASQTPAPDAAQPVVPAEPDHSALANIQSTRQMDPVRGADSALLDGMAKLEQQVKNGEASMADFQGFLKANNLLK